MDKEQPSYYAIIPANVRYDQGLPANAKLLYGEITALCNKEGRCWAGNYYFANLYSVSKRSISKWIKSLIEKGYVRSEIKYKKGSEEIEYRYITLVPYPMEEKFNTPMEEKFRDNNTFINNTNNKKIYIDSLEETPNPKDNPTYTFIDEKDGIEKEFTLKELVETCTNHLGNKTGHNFSANNQETIKNIKGRLAEGHSPLDFQKVIDKKCKQWLNDPLMKKYLKPPTLFCKKHFADYLEE